MSEPSGHKAAGATQPPARVPRRFDPALWFALRDTRGGRCVDLHPRIPGPGSIVAGFADAGWHAEVVLEHSAQVPVVADGLRPAVVTSASDGAAEPPILAAHSHRDPVDLVVVRDDDQRAPQVLAALGPVRVVAVTGTHPGSEGPVHAALATDPGYVAALVADGVAFWARAAEPDLAEDLLADPADHPPTIGVVIAALRQLAEIAEREHRLSIEVEATRELMAAQVTNRTAQLAEAVAERDALALEAAQLRAALEQTRVALTQTRAELDRCWKQRVKSVVRGGLAKVRRDA